jgi:hypothetical protein
MDPYKIWENLIDLYNRQYGTQIVFLGFKNDPPGKEESA